MDLHRELQGLQFSAYPEIFQRMKKLSETEGASFGDLMGAFTGVMGRYGLNPYIQNQRVKSVSTLPELLDKNKVVNMLSAPQNHERGLRSVAHALEFNAYPFFKIRKTYQDILTYHWYNYPAYLDDGFDDWDGLYREWRLVDKLCEKLKPHEVAHMACGQALQEGKSFYVTRWDADKSHNGVRYAFAQQLPSDWCKIVGFNNKSKYTVAFNMLYFCRPGTDPADFGDLFVPYWDRFQSVVRPKSTRSMFDRDLVLGADHLSINDNFYVNETAFRDFRNSAESESLKTELYKSGSRWYYWVYLPPERVSVFEIDDTNALAASPLMGLFLSMLQLSRYEDLQMELVSNPLIAVLTGEIPYFNETSANTADGYKLSNAGRMMFEALWYQMLMSNNTSGIGLYLAPAENIKLQQLAEAPSATEIAGNGYAYTMQKAGLTSIIPANTDPRVGQANISLQLESRFPQAIYNAAESMVNNIYQSLNLKYDWRFRMFGSLAEDEKTMEKAEKGMQVGILSDTLTYLALKGRTFTEDLSISRAIAKSGIPDLRLPLINNYSAKAAEGSLPPEVKHDLNPGGRPRSEGMPQTEGQENDEDSYGE